MARGVCVALALLVGASMLAAPVSALVHFDFEGPFLLDQGHTLKDHAIIQADGIWHCFYIRGDLGSGSSSENELGHATSPDLRNWTILPPVIAAGPESWDSRNVWAPTILTPSPYSPTQSLMIYTGADGSVVQRAGLASAVGTSYGNWSKMTLANPWIEPDSLVYEWSPTQQYSSFRDPFYYKIGGKHHLLHTAKVQTPSGPKGAIHHLESWDFNNWTDPGPLFVHNGSASEYWHDLESVQLHQAEGFWHLFFSEFNTLGVRYLRSTEMDSGWDINLVSIFDLGTAPEVTPVGNGRYVFTRHAATTVSATDSVFWTIRADSLYFNPTTGNAVNKTWNVLQHDWPQRSGTSFLSTPTFGDNSLMRGDTPTQPAGHGYLSSSEFYSGPLGTTGSPGASLGGAATGTMKSRVFTLEGIRIDLLVSGGLDPNCFVALMDAVADTAFHTAYANGSITMQSVSWPIDQLQGMDAYVWVEDDSSLSDGYINVDDIKEIGDGTAAPAAPVRRGPGTLLPNVPNPFNPRTELRFDLDGDAWVGLEIYDTRGRLVRSLAPRAYPAGRHARLWDGQDGSRRDVASGSYLVRLRVDGAPSDAQSITLVR